MTIVIGLGHRAGVGKDTLADYMVKRYGFTKYAFADPLKRAAREIFGFTKEQVEEQSQKKEVDPFWGFTPRYALQKLGTEAVRNVFGPDTWVKAAARAIELGGQDRIVFTDVRFRSEADWLRTVGEVWRIDRIGITDQVRRIETPGRVEWQDTRTDEILHPSESDLIEYGFWNRVLEASANRDAGVKLQLQVDQILPAMGLVGRGGDR